VLCLAGGAWGQVPEAESLKGELRGNSPALLHSEVKLSDLYGGAHEIEASVSADGRFEFRHVPYGEYRLTVFDGGDQPIHEELISVRDRMQPIQIEVTPREAQRPPAGAVSAQELLHPPTKEAVKACLAAQKSSLAGAHEKAAEQLAQAIRLSPGYTAAWINLAVQHIYLKQYRRALQELTHAAEMSPPTSLVYSNTAYAQFALHRYDDGILSAREALRLDPSCVQAHYLLGSVLALDRRTRVEGIQHLEIAARTIPAAQAELELARRETAQVVPHP
jgi:tetratricopeptide (TPR) repeat protein